MFILRSLTLCLASAIYIYIYKQLANDVSLTWKARHDEDLVS